MYNDYHEQEEQHILPLKQPWQLQQQSKLKHCQTEQQLRAKQEEEQIIS
jgi:hypothetical protein